MAAGGLLTTVPTPGFFHLDLFIQDTKDVKSWYDDLKRRLDMEKGAMENAMTNLLSVFAFHKVRGKGEARKLLETLTRKEVDNLNAIANKQFIYGQLMRTKDEMACRDRLQELLADKSDAARARNARCFAEQGYALEFVREDSKDMVSKIKNAISLFETALNLVCDTDAVTEEERLVWKYYMSKCYWRLDQVVSYSQDQASLINKNQYDQLQKQVRHGAPLPPKQLLRRAKEDAVASCDGAMTKLNIHHLGKVCHRLAINPATERVEDREELGDALDNFAQALLLDDGYTDPRVHADMARSLEATGEHEKAAESYKRADDNGASGAVSLKQSQTEKVNLPVAVAKPRHGQEFQYDFFVSHSSKDADWVDFALLPAMEADLGFKGCVADRDFVPGKSVIDNIIYSIENSYKTLLILTPNFVTSEWCKYETQQALMESLKCKTGRVIPIMLRDCQVPASVRTITYLDVSRDAIGSYDWLKLKKALEERPPIEEK
ncbi:TLR1 [Branchiostoma lanceolatum]|uniref:TLR1 protein n=1 Tax=Branchiostoma lanceolatum TaxID=7740 RepID=A0A8J9ZTN4_BRALA|nr:TLR1 [Branchiostoma lanceolatum]